MTRFRAVLFFMLVALVLVSANTFAGKVATNSESFLAAHHTTSQSAIFGAFLGVAKDAEGVVVLDTALSFSNVTANPGTTVVEGVDNLVPKDGGSYFSIPRVVGEVNGLSGGLTAWVYAEDGTFLPVPLDPLCGELGPGETCALLVSEVAGPLLGPSEFLRGYAWVIADFGAVSGTVTNLWLGFAGGVAGTFLMEPVLGGIPVEPAPVVEP